MTSSQRAALEAALLDNCTTSTTHHSQPVDATNDTSAATTAALRRARRTEPQVDVPTFYVDPKHDPSTEATPPRDGTSASRRVTVRTVSEAVALARNVAPAGSAKRVVLAPGVHFLGWNGTMELGAADSGLTIASSLDGQVRPDNHQHPCLNTFS